MDAPPAITFLSDYGLRDEFVGVCHAVIARLCPAARVIDLTHAIPRHDIRAGAVALRGALAYLPEGVVLAVVDPRVGGERRAIALRCGDGRLMVGPDNGLLAPAAARAGGVVEAIDVARSRFRLEPVSATFHGRDLFAPVAAELAAGAALADAGEPVDPDELVTLELSRAHQEDGALVAHVIAVDGFGNVQLDAEHGDLDGSGVALGRAVEVESGRGERRVAHFVTSFAEVASGALLVYEDAARALALAVNRGSAARDLALAPGSEVRLRPA